MEVFKFLLLFGGGFIAAFYASTVGGMGFITLPLLLFLGVPTPLAIGTNRLVSFAMDIVSSIKFYLHKQISLKIAIVIGVIVSIGSFAGAHLVTLFTKEGLKYFTIIVLVFAFFLNFYSKKISDRAFELKKRHFFIALPVLLLLGLYGGVIGIAFGTLIILIPPFMGYNFIQSAGIARISGAMMSLTATYVFISQNLVNYSYAFPMSLGVIAGSWLGIPISIKKGDLYIKTLLGIILLATIIQLLFFSK